jgi:hypothetical protein
MKVYHGSDVRIDVVDLHKCKPYKDFGKGFYVTTIRAHAQEMAQRIARWHDTKPFVTEFEFNEFAFNDEKLRVLRFSDYTEAWLDFVVDNRNKETDKHAYDIVEGPVADDRVTRRIYAYLRGEVSKAAFLEELKHKEPTHQICFCTAKALQMIVQTELKGVTAIEDIAEIIVETLMTDLALNEEEATDLYYTSDTYAALSDVSTGLYHCTWQEIYDKLKQELKR